MIGVHGLTVVFIGDIDVFMLNGLGGPVDFGARIVLLELQVWFHDL
jgi:hypothetical protein